MISMWLVIALLGNALLATVGVIDKLILTKAVSKPIIFVFYSTIFVLPVFLLIPFGVIALPMWSADYAIFIVSGLCFAFGLWAMYVAIAKGEVSRIGPLIGAATPLFILCLGNIFLQERLGKFALIASVFLIVGSLVISFEKKETQSPWHAGLEWAVLSGFLFAISHVSAKYAYTTYGFASGFLLTKLPIGMFGLSLLASPSVRALFIKKPAAATHSSGIDPITIQKHKSLIRYQVLLVGGNTVLGAAGAVLLQYAMALGSVSLVNALAGVQFALLIVLVAVISRFWPTILKETFTKQEIIQKIIAVCFIGVGLILLLL